jgi:hypothetical protein
MWLVRAIEKPSVATDFDADGALKSSAIDVVGRVCITTEVVAG